MHSPRFFARLVAWSLGLGLSVAIIFVEAASAGSSTSNDDGRINGDSMATAPRRNTATVLPTRAPASVLPEGRSAPERFAAPFVFGEAPAVAPRSRFGIGYTWAAVLHGHTSPGQGLQIVEGGFTTHRDYPAATYLPLIPDPSDAFMNLAVQATMQNTGKDFREVVHLIEAALVQAKDCVKQFGVDHPCSASAGGTTFDYATMHFWVRIRPSDALDTKHEMPAGYGLVVAVEKQDGLFTGPAFNRVAGTKPEAPQTSSQEQRALSSGFSKTKQHTNEYVVPSADASPIAIVDFLLKTKSRDLAWLNDSLAMRRVLSRSLAATWHRADALAEENHTVVFEGSWLSGELSFEPGTGTWEAHADGDNVVADSEQAKVIFQFVRDGRAWKIGNVIYDGTTIASNGRRVPRSLLSFAEMEIAEHDRGAHSGSIGREPAERVVGLDMEAMTLRGEHGTTYDHNGSEVVVFEKAGLIVYDNPKLSLSAIVKRGDVLFTGHISNGASEGKAFAFKNGCDPAPYKVEGRWLHGALVLSGAAPIAEERSCAIKGYSKTGKNALLVIRQAVGGL